MKQYAIFLMCIALAGCHSLKDQPDSGSEVDDAGPSITGACESLPLRSRASVKAFYERRGNELFWIDNNVFTFAADSLVQLVRNASSWGLIPEDYHALELDRLMEDSVTYSGHPAIDVLLSDAYLTMYQDLKSGRLDAATLERLNISQTVNEEAVRSLFTVHGKSLARSLRSAEPLSPEYHALKNALAGLDLVASDSLYSLQSQTLALNMERWRWRTKRHDRYLLVNIPSFMLRAIEKDSIWLETRVIVGKRETPTPIMEGIIRSFIIYPYWHVPKSISTREILPDLQKDGDYLRRNNFDVLDRDGAVVLPDTIQWDLYTSEYFPFVLRQREGSENSMGIIKFVFANKYGVYLHDTNSKRLFARTRRDLSHGCVRVSKAVSLAHYLVREDDIYVSPEDLDQYLSLQQRLTITLRKPIPLQLAYFTAEVIDNETLFYDDIYRQDSIMLRALYDRPGEAGMATALPGL